MYFVLVLWRMHGLFVFLPSPAKSTVIVHDLDIFRKIKNARSRVENAQYFSLPDELNRLTLMTSSPSIAASRENCQSPRRRSKNHIASYDRLMPLTLFHVLFMSVCVCVLYLLFHSKNFYCKASGGSERKKKETSQPSAIQMNNDILYFRYVLFIHTFSN